MRGQRSPRVRGPIGGYADPIGGPVLAWEYQEGTETTLHAKPIAPYGKALEEMRLSYSRRVLAGTATCVMYQLPYVEADPETRI